MAVTSTWSQSDLNALEALIKSGVRSGTIGDKSVSFQSLAEMLTLRDRMRAELDTGAASTVFAGRL